MAVLASRQAASALQVRPRAVGAVAVRRSRLVVRAVDQETQTQENQTQAPPAVDFAPQKIEGFVEKDSAGQANMYPTIMRPFEAGSDADNAQSQSAESDTRMLAGGAGVLAGLLVVAGLFAATLPSGQPEAQPAGEFQSLSAYQAKFAVELGLNKPAPALVQIPAPALIEPAVEVPEPVAEVARQEEAAPAEEAAVEVPPVVASE